MIRTIEFTVNENGTVPSVPQFAGVQGEHNATRLVFNLSNAVIEEISRALNNNKSVIYRFDFEKSDGTVISSLPTEITGTDSINFDLSRSYTSWGGGGVLTLVISIYSNISNQYATYISVPIRLYFKDFPGAGPDADDDISILYLHTKQLRDDTYTLAQTAQETLSEINTASESFNSDASEALESLAQISESVESNAQSAAGYAQSAEGYCQSAMLSKQSAQSFKNTAEQKAEECQSAKDQIDQKYDEIVEYAAACSQSVSDAELCETRMQNTADGIVARLGSDIATLVNGKIPVSQIPEVALTGVFTASSASDMNALTAQDGDICIRTDENKTYIYASGWTTLLVPTDTCSYAGYADTAGTAQNSLKIGGKSIVYLTDAEYAQIVPDANTYYFVG